MIAQFGAGDDHEEIRGIDGLTKEMRRSKYDVKKCHRCGLDWKEGLAGWYVPGFGAYFDTSYVCPECLILFSEEYKIKQEGMTKCNDELANINIVMLNLPGESSYVYRDENGSMYLDCEGMCYEKIYIQTLVARFQDYELRENDILRIRKKRAELINRRDELIREREAHFVGSGYNPVANT